MRLLNTNTARLKEFANHEEIPSYAILSHVWQQQEQTLQEVRSLDPQDCPRDHVSPKIRQCCIFAEAEGFEWIWIDTCCIDKTSSAELSEAINSMYAWYAIADVCYVWLHDVDDTHPSRHRSFSKSIWFQRGWTLQELIAPAYVVFLSRDWHTLGTKQTLAHRIEEITGIDCDVLLRRVELSQISVARRMSWAAFRKTTRLEDRAYSLLGIFDVHIPTIYGEGSNAFLRLQLEILKQCPDQSLFAWGPPAIDYDALIANGTSPTFVGPELEDPSLGSLLAVSPSNFANSSDITPMSLDVLGERIDLEGMRPPDYTYTSYGIRATFPLVNVPISRNPIILLAVLACQDSHDNLIALLLHQRLRDASAYYRYHVGVDLKARTVSDNNHNPPFSRCYRTCTIPLQSLALLLKEDRQRQIQIGDVYIDNPKATFPRPLRNLPSVASIGRGIAATSYAFFFPAWVLKHAGVLPIIPDTASDTGYDGLMLEVSPGAHPSRTVLFARDVKIRPRSKRSGPEGIRFSACARCSCSSSPLQHPMSLAVDMINPSYDPSAPHSDQSPSSGHGRSRSLSSNRGRHDEKFIQTLLHLPSNLSPARSNPGSSSPPRRRSRSPLVASEQEKPWLCSSGRTHLPTISNPYIRLRFFNVLGKVEITLKRWEGCRRSQATFVYLVELKLAPAGSEAAERPLSFMNYTEAPTTGGGFILYDANAPDAEPLPIKNALQLEGSDMASAADGIKIFVSTQTDSTEDERDTGSHLSPLLTLSPLSAGPERGHTRRHSSPNPEPFSYAGGPYNNASLPRQVSPSRSLHSPELPSPYLSPHSPSTASFDPAFLSPHQSPRPPTRPLPSDTSVSPGHSPRGWDGRELPSETYDALRTPRLPYSALPSPSVLTDELPEHSLSAPVSPFLGLQRYAASATHTQRGRSPSHERGHVSRWS
ncbi:hypothetical protein BD310DRAFT_384045 [Dichomitus squalens]|uniref:Uncharacterized protein n=1 Tax=Dichomitus squalens TaxID=114155 RepID=A0A4Q9PYG1_9APHY|nr:hypothetical protein BD310DRAFT_384045 [Dichomitus squalens]